MPEQQNKTRDVAIEDHNFDHLVQIAKVIRNGDRVYIGLMLKGKSRWLHVPVFAEIVGDEVKEHGTEPFGSGPFIDPPSRDELSRLLSQT